MGKLLRFLFWLAVFTGAFVGVARLTVVRWWRIPADDRELAASVAPTLAGGDLVLLWRGTPPRFGSLVVCPDPEDPAYSVVGRIAGEEGDRVLLEGNDVTVNGERAGTERACDSVTVEDPVTGNDVELYCDIEALGGVSHARGAVRGDHPAFQRTEREVGKGRVFLLSDNRAHPLDSRHYGGVERSTCKESVFFRLVSKNGFSDAKRRLTYIR